MGFIFRDKKIFIDYLFFYNPCFEVVVSFLRLLFLIICSISNLQSDESEFNIKDYESVDVLPLNLHGWTFWRCLSRGI